MWVTCPVSNKGQELLALLEHMCSQTCYWWGPCYSYFQFYVLCCTFLFSLSASCVLCAQFCQCLWLVNSWLSFWFSLKFIKYIMHEAQCLSVLYNNAALPIPMGGLTFCSYMETLPWPHHFTEKRSFDLLN
jgi:hypothetical protein